jgi:hydroxymethylbilane synthase
LALWQAHWVRDRLTHAFPSSSIEIVIIKTTGDRIQDAPLSRIGDKGLFTREIERALLDGAIDLAVHSLKDLPTHLPDGLLLGAVTEREDVRDVFLPRPDAKERTLSGQAAGAVIATGSLRRTSQILHTRPDLAVIDLRGNLNTRYQKLTGSTWGGMVLARAGVVRLGWAERIGETLDPQFMLPAVGQGALGIEIRTKDKKIRNVVKCLHHEETSLATTAERALLRALEGGCQVPIGTYARIEKGKLIMDAIVGSLDGTHVVRGSKRGAPSAADALGRALADDLLAQGARAILEAIRNAAKNA